MMSYPLEKDKGKSFSVFWAIFQFGSFIGSIIALAINIRSGGLTSVSTSTYIVSRIPSRSFRVLKFDWRVVGILGHYLHWYRFRLPHLTS